MSTPYPTSGQHPWGSVLKSYIDGTAADAVAAAQASADAAAASAASIDRGAANGVAELDGSGLVPVAEIPSLPYAEGVGTGVNALTGMIHADGYGDGTLKTSNVNLAMVDAKGSSGSVVYLRAGAWTCDEPINMSGSQIVKLLGAGHTLTRVSIDSASSYGFLEVVNSVAAHIEGIGFTMGTSGSAQYGILGGRGNGDASTPYLKLRDVYVYGRFSLAACFVLNAEQAHYEDCIFWSDAGKGLVLARDQVNYPTITARWSALSTTSGYAGGDGIIRLDRVQCTTTRNSTDGPTDYPLTVEYAQTFVATSVYTISAGPALVVLDKRIDQATFVGLHQEWFTTNQGATEPYGIYLKATTTGSESRIVRLGVEGSSLYPIYGEDNVKVTSLRVKSSGWRTTTRTYNVDVWTADVCELPSFGNYTATSGNEDSTPTYQRRDGSPMVSWTPMEVLRVTQAVDFGSIAAGAVSGVTVTVTGARVGDGCQIEFNPGGLTAGIVIYAGVSAVDTVTVRAQNCTSAAIDPAAFTAFISVMKFS